MWIFYQKHYKDVYNFAVTGLVWLGIWSKYALEIGKNTFKSSGNRSERRNKSESTLDNNF